MSAVQVSTTSELPAGTMKAFTVEGTEVLVANCDGALYAVSNICTHMGGHLADGQLNGVVVKCPRHGACFDLRTGANVAPAEGGPAEMPPAALRTYVVTVEDEAVRVQL